MFTLVSIQQHLRGRMWLGGRSDAVTKMYQGSHCAAKGSLSKPDESQTLVKSEGGLVVGARGLGIVYTAVSQIE